MDIKQIEEKVENCIKNKTDMNAKAKMNEAVTDYLKEKKVTDEIIDVIIKAMVVDRGSNFYDYLSELTEKALQEVMKVIKNNKTIKEGGSANALRMLSGLLYLSVIGEGNLASIRGSIIDLISNMAFTGKNAMSKSVYEPVFEDYFIKEFDNKFEFPEWKGIKAQDENIALLCDALSDVAEADGVEASFGMKKWLNDGSRYAKEAIEKKKLEAQIPRSRIADIVALSEHYQEVEDKLRDFVYKNDGLKKEIKRLEEQIQVLNKEKVQLEQTIKDLHNDVDESQKKINEAEKEASDRKALNDAFGALKKNDESALLNDIADDLKAEYKDFVASENDEMELQLGEIYREKIKNIFKILDRKGIKVQ